MKKYCVYFELMSGFIDFYSFPDFKSAESCRDDLFKDKSVKQVSEVVEVELYDD